MVVRYAEGSYAGKGYVDRAEATLDKHTRTLDVIVRVPNPFSAGVTVNRNRSAGGVPPLLAGEFVEVEIEGVAMKGYFKVPWAALQTGNEVWIVKDGVVSDVSVRVPQRAGNEVFVTGLLEDGQVMITAGIQFATQGMRVQTETDESP